MSIQKSLGFNSYQWVLIQKSPGGEIIQLISMSVDPKSPRGHIFQFISMSVDPKNPYKDK